MKILVLAPHFAPRFEGGTEIVARAQARELKARGHDVSVLAGCDTPFGGSEIESERVDGLEVRFLPRREHERYDLLLERPRILEIVRASARAVDLVHLHGWSTFAGGLVVELSAFVPVAVTLHDLFVTCPRFFRLAPAPIAACPPRAVFEPCARCIQPDAPGQPLERLERDLLERSRRWQAEVNAAAALIVPSESHCRRLRALVDLDPARTRVIPHGLCRSLPSQGAASDWDGTGPLRILHLGNLTAAKGVFELADAAARIAAGGREIELVFAGAALEDGLEQALRERSGGARTHFLGPFEPASLAARLEELGGCHLAVLPSRAFESYGLVVDESLALGLPTWVSDRGAPKERIGPAGRVLPAQDAIALEEALSSLYADPAALRLQKAAVPAQVAGPARAADALERLFRSLV